MNYLASIISQSLQPPRSAGTAPPVSATPLDKRGPEQDLPESDERMQLDNRISDPVDPEVEQRGNQASEVSTEPGLKPLPDTREAKTPAFDDQSPAPAETAFRGETVDEAPEISPAVPASPDLSSGDDADSAASATPESPVTGDSAFPEQDRLAGAGEEQPLPVEAEAPHRPQEIDRMVSVDEPDTGNRESTLQRMVESAERQLQPEQELTAGIAEREGEDIPDTRPAQPDTPQVPEPIRQVAETIAAFQAEAAAEDSTPPGQVVAGSRHHESKAETPHPAVELSPRQSLPPGPAPVADALRSSGEQETPQVRIGQINVLIDEQGGKPKKAATTAPATGPSPFGLRGL